jgi:hypothetical protein
MSQLPQQGVFKMIKLLSVNVRAKVWEIKKVDERFVISHQHQKNEVIIIASPAQAYLDKKCNRSRGRLSIGWRGLGGVEEVERQWADRVLERLNNAGGKQRVDQ